MGNNRVEILVPGAPRQRRVNAVDISDQCRCVARAAPGNINSKITPAHALYRIYHLKDRGAPSVAAVERGAGATTAKIGERCRMRLSQITDVDVVANACT